MSTRYLVTALGLTQPPKSDVYPLADRPLLSSGSQYRYLTIIGDGRVARSFPPLQQGHRRRSSCHVGIKLTAGPTFKTHFNRSYICSRIFLHNPPGEDNALTLHPGAPEALKAMERNLAEEDPEASSWVCLGAIAITIALMAATKRFVLDSFVMIVSSNQDLC